MKKCSNCNIILSPKDEVCPKCGFNVSTEVKVEEEPEKPLMKKVVEHPKSLKIAIYSIIVIIFAIVIWWVIRALDSQYEYYKIDTKRKVEKEK